MDQSKISVPITTEQFLRIADFLREVDSSRDPVWAVAFAIDYWLDNASWKDLDDLVPEPPPPPASDGYVWKQLVLPPGTELRMTYDRDVHHARVEGDYLVFNGKRTSPNAMVKAIANNTTRNAWRDLFVKRPTDRKFRMADELRREQLSQRKQSQAARNAAKASEEAS